MMEKNSSRNIRVWQEAGSNLTGNVDQSIVVKYAIKQDGSTTFIAAEAKSPVRSFKTTYKPTKIWSICNFRINAIQRLIEGRHSGPCDTDDGLAYFDVALLHLAARRVAMNHGDETVKSLEWAERWTPELVREKGRAWFDEQEAKILVALDCRKRPPLPSADQVADALNITAGEVATHKMKTIGAVDRRKGVRVAQAKVKHADKQRDDRVAAGATPRAESMAKTKPWEAHGMSRATYYRKIEKGELQPDTRMKKLAGKPTPTGTVLRLVRSA